MTQEELDKGRERKPRNTTDRRPTMSELKAYRFVLATESSNLGGVVYTSKYVYAQDDVDKLLAKKDKEIAELKAENERLKKQSSCTFSDDSLRVRQLKRKIADNSEKILELQKALDVALSEVYSLLDKIESLKASHYAEMVDAGMENRKLKRALWLTRALRARDIQRWWIAATCSKTTERACSVWNNVERKCREKAEEYK